MNPEYTHSFNYYPTKDYAKEAKLKQSQTWKKSNQKHPAFRKGK